MSHASESAHQPPNMLSFSKHERLLPLFSRHHHSTARFPTNEELEISFRRLKEIYEKRGEPATVKQQIPAIDALFNKRHQLSPRNCERVKAAFDIAALLLECKAPYHEVASILRANRIIETSKGAIPPIRDATVRFLRELHSVLPDALRGDPNAPDSLAKLYEMGDPAQDALNQLDQPALDAMMQLMAYYANQYALGNPHAPSPPISWLTARQAIELASLGGEYLQIVEISRSNPVVCQHLTFENFLSFPLFFGRAVKAVFEGWAAHGTPERLSIGSLMIHAIRKSLDVRFDDLAMAFPRGRVPLVVEDFFAARRKKIDAFLQAHHTLTPAEMATLLGECNSLDKVKWFMAEEVDDGSPITREALDEYLDSLPASHAPQQQPGATFSLSHHFVPISRRLAGSLDGNATAPQVERAQRW
ncbi:hypothetical protein NBRC10512_006861 [Rhodotorula toruloides]|uniref:RHTO0S31e00188g1_1 n=2 Tax=Rhodotorula toruloides TaxID=5286 RepID=A0A061BNZ0_RHOTO|nr:uncharacterized protein RHTO_01554 [Rhodotorula toruloides NP11]EMS21494.1 hypothetical protein RHTO_01554 [Rhodotorula toruloides NP11]CDR49725.1 RHTO0S31e00188g1_1 [Rhodotorula toruloides]